MFCLSVAFRVFIILALGACRKPIGRLPDAARDAGSATSVQGAAPASFRITSSSGGGFTGLWQGCTLAAPDQAAGWQRTAAGPRIDLWSRKADPESLSAFARALENQLGTKLEGAGNLTLRLEYVSPRGEYQWSVPGSGASPAIPDPFRTNFLRIETYCRSLAAMP